MYKIAVIGDYDSIYGFAALGLDIFPAVDRKEIEAKLTALAEHGYGIIYITEAAAAECGQLIEKLQERILPAIIQIPRCVRQHRKWSTGCEKLCRTGSRF